MSYGSNNYYGIAGETITVGDALRFQHYGANAGRLMKAVADASNFEVVGVAIFPATSGNAVSVGMYGTVAARFLTPPDFTSNGLTVYLDPVLPGTATLDIPVASGKAIVILGKLTGANGVTLTPLICIAISTVAVLG